MDTDVRSDDEQKSAQTDKKWKIIYKTSEEEIFYVYPNGRIIKINRDAPGNLIEKYECTVGSVVFLQQQIFGSFIDEENCNNCRLASVSVIDMDSGEVYIKDQKAQELDILRVVHRIEYEKWFSIQSIRNGPPLHIFLRDHGYPINKPYVMYFVLVFAITDEKRNPENIGMALEKVAGPIEIRRIVDKLLGDKALIMSQLPKYVEDLRRLISEFKRKQANPTIVLFSEIVWIIRNNIKLEFIYGHKEYSHARFDIASDLNTAPNYSESYTKSGLYTKREHAYTKDMLLKYFPVPRGLPAVETDTDKTALFICTLLRIHTSWMDNGVLDIDLIAIISLAFEDKGLLWHLENNKVLHASEEYRFESLVEFLFILGPHLINIGPLTGEHVPRKIQSKISSNSTMDYDRLPKLVPIHKIRHKTILNY